MVAGSRRLEAHSADCLADVEDMKKATAVRQVFDDDLAKWKAAGAPLSEKPKLNTGPPLLDIALDTTNPEVRRYVLLYTYDINRMRGFPAKVVTCAPEHEYEDGSQPPPTQFQATKDERYKCDYAKEWELYTNDAWKRRQFTNNQKRWYEDIYLDEGQKIRNTGTQNFKCVWHEKADHYWLISGTPAINYQSDNVAFIEVVWPRIQKHLQQDAPEDVQKWFKDRADNS